MHRLSDLCTISITLLMISSYLVFAQVNLMRNTRPPPQNNNQISRGDISSSNAQSSDDGPIIYPDSMNQKCIHDICFDVKDYPTDLVKQLVAESDIAKKYLDGIDLNNRLRPDEEDFTRDTLCEVKRHILRPQMAKNLDNQMRTVINTDEKTQTIVSETCADKGACKFSKNFPLGYTSTCTQKYNVVKLMIMTDNRKIDFDNFQIPQCCECTLTKTM